MTAKAGDQWQGKIDNVTAHAQQRAVERFRVKQNVAENWVRSRLKEARFVSTIANDEGSTKRLYATDRIGFVVDLYESNVITLYEPRQHATITDKVHALLFRELRKYETEERKVERANTVKKAELDVELAEMKLADLRARSESKKQSYQARIEAIEAEKVALDEEIANVRREKTKIAKGVASFV